MIRPLLRLWVFKKVYKEYRQYHRYRTDIARAEVCFYDKKLRDRQSAKIHYKGWNVNVHPSGLFKHVYQRRE